MSGDAGENRVGSAPDAVPPDGAAGDRGEHAGELDPAAVRLGDSGGAVPGAGLEDPHLHTDLHTDREPSGLPLMW